MTAQNDDILDGLFHGCALAAFVDQAEQQRGWPDRELTRRLAFQYYEEALAEKNRRIPAPSTWSQSCPAADITEPT
jgi:hypothetical protein